MDNLNLVVDLINYMKDEEDQNQETKDLYKSFMYSLEDMEYLQRLPEKYQDQSVVEDAWEICKTRSEVLDVDGHYYDEAIPKYLLKIKGIKEYFTNLILNEIEKNIDKVFADNYEYIESYSIEKVIKDLTLENARDICNDYIEHLD